MDLSAIETKLEQLAKEVENNTASLAVEARIKLENAISNVTAEVKGKIAQAVDEAKAKAKEIAGEISADIQKVATEVETKAEVVVAEVKADVVADVAKVEAVVEDKAVEVKADAIAEVKVEEETVETKVEDEETTIENDVKKDVQEAKTFVLNHNHYAIIISVLAVIVITLSVKYFAPGEGASIFAVPIRISSASLQGIALWVVTFITFMACLKGLKCDLLDEVVNKKNTAASILLGFIGLALAVVIHG